MQNPLYDDITSKLARLEAKRVWEKLKPETVKPHAKLRWPDGRAERIAWRLLSMCSFTPVTGCVDWRGGLSPNGYGQLGLGSRDRTWTTHRLSWFLFSNRLAPGQCVLHKCDRKQCVNPYHLFIGTHLDNALDRVNKGRGLRGDQVFTAKLTENQVLEIRARYKAHSKLDGGLAIARDYGMSYQQIEDIVHRRNWSWLP